MLNVHVADEETRRWTSRAEGDVLGRQGIASAGQFATHIWVRSRVVWYYCACYCELS